MLVIHMYSFNVQSLMPSTSCFCFKRNANTTIAYNYGTWFYTIDRTACLDNNLNKLLNYSMKEQSQQDVELEC